MSAFREFITLALSYARSISIADLLDILIVAFLIYQLIRLVRTTSSSKVAKGLLILLLATWLSGIMQMTVVNFLLRTAMEMGLLAIVVLFQPELRRMLEKVGTTRFIAREKHIQTLDAAIAQTVLACGELSASRTGALLVFERDNRLEDQIRTGTVIDSATTAELIKNVFYPKAPLHDGAVIVRDGRIRAAGCMLPLSHNTNLSRDLGMRHRAGIGMSENSDAIVVIVSEETGGISVAVDGMLKRHLATDTFDRLLRSELLGEAEAVKKSGGHFPAVFRRKEK